MFIRGRLVVRNIMERSRVIKMREIGKKHENKNYIWLEVLEM